MVDSFKKIREKLVKAFGYALGDLMVPFLFIILTFIVGENHPFSKFPMYSQFPSNADYFYLAEETGKPISAYKIFKFRTNELKDMIQIKVKNYQLDRENNAQLSVAAKEVLRLVLENNEDNPQLKKIKSIHLVRHQIIREGNKIREVDIPLAVVNL
jgi:hypothetical protein